MKWRRRQTPFLVAMTKGRKLARLVLIGRPPSETARKSARVSDRGAVAHRLCAVACA